MKILRIAGNEIIFSNQDCNLTILAARLSTCHLDLMTNPMASTSCDQSSVYVGQERNTVIDPRLFGFVQQLTTLPSGCILHDEETGPITSGRQEHKSETEDVNSDQGGLELIEVCP